jgi:hypothetical protein
MSADRWACPWTGLISSCEQLQVGCLHRRRKSRARQAAALLWQAWFRLLSQGQDRRPGRHRHHQRPVHPRKPFVSTEIPPNRRGVHVEQSPRRQEHQPGVGGPQCWWSDRGSRLVRLCQDNEPLQQHQSRIHLCPIKNSQLWCLGQLPSLPEPAECAHRCAVEVRLSLFSLFDDDFRPDAHTQVRGRIDSAAVVGISLNQRITNYLKLTLCAEVSLSLLPFRPSFPCRPTRESSAWRATNSGLESLSSSAEERSRENDHL